MTRSSLFVTAGTLLGGLVVLTGYAMAQGAPSVSEQVIVVAPYITHQAQKTMTGAGNNRGTYDVVTLTKNVSYADLDLSMPSDANRFVQRIHDAAKESCDQLKAQFRDPPYSPVTTDEECVKTANDQAMEVANLIIDRSQMARETPAAAPSMAQAEPAPAVEAEAIAVPRKQDRN